VPAQGRHRQRGLSLLEFTLVVIIFALLVVFAFQRIAALQADMEDASIRYTVGAMREALALDFARLIASGRLDRARDLIDANALALLQRPPRDYGGTVASARQAALRPGHWYYDRAAGTVIYQPRFGAAGGDRGGPLMRWRVVPRWTDTDGDGRYEPATESIHGLALERIDDAKG